MDVLKPRKKHHRVCWFVDGSYGHVAVGDAKDWDANGFERSLESVKRGKDKLELALANARAYEANGGVVERAKATTTTKTTDAAEDGGVDDEMTRDEAEAAALEVLMGGPIEEPKAAKGKKVKGSGRRKKLIEDQDDEMEAEPEENPAADDAEEYEPEDDDEEKPKGGKKRKLSKKADQGDKAKRSAKAASAKKEVEKPIVKVASSTPRLLELKSELEDGLQEYDDAQEQQEKARVEYEKARLAMEAAQRKSEQVLSHTNRVIRRLKQTARHIQEQSVNPVMLQETLITRTIKKGSKLKDPSLVDFTKTCAAVMTEWIDLVRNSPTSLITVKPVEEVKKVVKTEKPAPEEDAKMEEEEKQPVEEETNKPKLPPVMAEIYAKAGATMPAAKPVPTSSGVPKEPAHDATRLRVARYLEQEHGLSRNAAVTLEAAIFDQAADPGIAYKAALKRIVDQPNLLTSNEQALDSGNVKPALLLAFRGR